MIEKIVKKTKKVAHARGLVEWDELLSLETKPSTDTTSFKVAVYRASRGIGGLRSEKCIGDLELSWGSVISRFSTGKSLLIFVLYEYIKAINLPPEIAPLTLKSSDRSRSTSPLELYISIIGALDFTRSIIGHFNETSTTATSSTWTDVLKKLEGLILISEKIAEINPYAKLALSALTFAYDIWRRKSERDDNVSTLVHGMDDLCKIV
ncbi:hypothetical protein M422DRAFT_44647 [Sphaerobolus stellatus SS14]|nr:hypothetical protein M422DRAFT_44647 [Sphaerobolus stellatus SS14]